MAGSWKWTLRWISDTQKKKGRDINSSTEPWLRFSQTTPKGWLTHQGNVAQSLAPRRKCMSYFKLCSTSKQASAGNLCWPLYSQIVLRLRAQGSVGTQLSWEPGDAAYDGSHSSLPTFHHKTKSRQQNDSATGFVRGAELWECPAVLQTQTRIWLIHTTGNITQDSNAGQP